LGKAETEIYGKIRHNLKKSGRIIAPMDSLIAAHALSASCVLVTNNVKEFKNVPGLRIENWV
jgi:tRNA(fMet)-specific endonuclease VapC